MSRKYRLIDSSCFPRSPDVYSIQFISASAEYVFYLTSIFLILSDCFVYAVPGVLERRAIRKESKEMQEAIEESRQWEEFMNVTFCIVGHIRIKTPIAALNLLLRGEESEDTAVCRQELFKIESYVEMALNYLQLLKK